MSADKAARAPSERGRCPQQTGCEYELPLLACVAVALVCCAVSRLCKTVFHMALSVEDGVSGFPRRGPQRA